MRSSVSRSLPWIIRPSPHHREWIRCGASPSARAPAESHQDSTSVNGLELHRGDHSSSAAAYFASWRPTSPPERNGTKARSLGAEVKLGVLDQIPESTG